MSLYRSEVVLFNTSQTDQVVGGVKILVGGNATIWNTAGAYVSPEVVAYFDACRKDYTNLNELVRTGAMQCNQDGLSLTHDQFMILFSDMAEITDRGNDINSYTQAVKGQPTQPGGVPLTASAPRAGEDWVIGTHNFSDASTWFQDSGRVTGEQLSSDDGFTFSSAHGVWIDMYSGRMHNESFWVAYQQSTKPSDPHGYKVNVYVDGNLMTAREPFESTGGDYEIIWELGKVVFFEQQVGTVTADYSYPTTSFFHIATRSPDKYLIVEDAETDVSLDSIMTDALVYSWWAFDQGTGEWFEIGAYTYERVGQITTEAKGMNPVFRATGCTDKDREMPLPEFRRKCRGSYSDRQSVPFSYLCARAMSLGVEIRIYNKHHRQMGGEHITATLYCTERAVGS